MGVPKEVCFFQDTIDFQENPNYAKGWEWYQQAFEHYAGERMVGEATPSYTDRVNSPLTPRRIFDFNADFRLIYQVRAPFAMAVSGWKMQYYEGSMSIHQHRVQTQWALQGFDYWLDKQYEVGFWDTARYSYQLAAYQEYFPNSQLLVLFLEDWKIDQRHQIDRIAAFLDLDPEGLTNCEEKNRADQRFASTWLAKAADRSGARRLLKLATPTRLWESMRRQFARKPFIVPDPPGSTKTARAFLDYVNPDSSDLLREQGKPSDYWRQHCAKVA